MPNLAMRPDRLLTGYRPNIKCAGHLTIGLNPERFFETLHDIINVLSHHDFDAIAFRGLSGALFAPTVAMKMGKTLLAIRKTTANCHSRRIVEGDYNTRRYVILDDFISSGETVRHIIEEVCDAIPDARCIGVCEYMYIHNNAAAQQLKSVDAIFDNIWRVKPKRESLQRPSPWDSPVFDVVKSNEPLNQGKLIRRGVGGFLNGERYNLAEVAKMFPVTK